MKIEKIHWKPLIILGGITLVILCYEIVQLSNPITAQSPFTVEVSEPVLPQISIPVYSIKPDQKPPVRDQVPHSLLWLGEIGQLNDPVISDPLAPTGLNRGITTDPLLTFEGLGSDGIAPPDPVGDVGPDHYVQMVSVSFQIWDKGDPDNGIAPNILQEDTLFNQLFTGFGGSCETRNDGNPIVLYDDLADRWVLSQFALDSPLSLCIAVSTSPDPTGTYYLYQFPMPAFPDYPKLGMWQDAYYVGTHSGLPNEFYAHALDRNQMLAGLPATRQSVGSLPNFVMPVDADGQITPPAESAGIFYTMLAEGYEHHPPGVDRLAVYEFAVDWEVPENSIFTLQQEIPLADFNYTVCGYFVQTCIPQPGTEQTLDSLSYWPMFRLQYRNFGNYASLVGNFTVDQNGEDKAAIRWFELHKIGDSYTLYQQGTYAPDDDHRWMGSIAMDVSGNIALGYSVSSAQTKPSLRLATRQASDPPGTFAAEVELWEGTGIQTEITRWGDYTNMAVDPIDGCHFWFTGEYHDVDDTGFNWNTRIGVFKVPSCGGNTGTLTGQVLSDAGGVPEATIQAYASITQTGTTLTDENGSYALYLPEARYVVTATAFGYVPGIVTGVEIISGTSTLQNFALLPAPIRIVSGTVSDAVTGWPLYAQISISGYPNNPIWTQPGTGIFQVELPEGNYTLEVSTREVGYLPESFELLVNNNLRQDIEMEVDADTCQALGYIFNGTVQPFDEEILPAGWETVDNINLSNPQVWQFNDPAGRGNLTGGMGAFGIVDSDYYGAGNSQDTSLISPVLDFSDLESVKLAFDTDLKVWDGNESNEKADVDISTDGGETWINVWHREMEDGNFNGRVMLDISEFAAYQPEVLIQFRYYDASYDWWWQVDNVAYGALTCDPISGGLVVGNAYDGNFHTPLNEVVISLQETISMTTQPTPDDPGVEDGFYTLFAPSGIYTLTATLPRYGTPNYPLVVEGGTTTRQDVILPTGWLVPDPNTVSMSLGFGYSATLPIKMANLGWLTATFNISTPNALSVNEIPWLSVSPVSGTLPAQSTLELQLILSAISITQTEIYSKNLIFVNDTPYGDLALPVTLDVGEPIASIAGSPDQTGVGIPGTSIHYTLSITNTGNIPDWFEIRVQKNAWEATTTLTTTFLNPGGQATFDIFIQIPSSAGYLDEDIATVSIEGVQTRAFTSIQIQTLAQYPFLKFLPVIQRKQ